MAARAAPPDRGEQQRIDALRVRLQAAAAENALGGGDADLPQLVQLVSGQILRGDDFPNAADIAIPLVVAPVRGNVPEPQTLQLRGQVRLYSGNNRFEIRKETLDSLRLSTIVLREGDAIEECIRFKTGSRSTLYTPLYLQFQPPPGGSLTEGGKDADFLLGEVSEYALVSQTHEAAKIELVILMRRAADRAFNMNETRRRGIYAVARAITDNPSWTPTNLDEAAPIARSLMNKARELVSMQADQGKVWRNAKTVDAIRSGAMAVAASLNEALLGI